MISVLDTTPFSAAMRYDESMMSHLRSRSPGSVATVRFIMPIERSPKLHYHRVFLDRFDTSTQKLERLATVLEAVPRQTFINSTIFGLRNGRVVFAFNSGWDSEQGSLNDLRVWDREAQSLIEAERVVAPRDAREIARYFGDYEGGLASYPGMMTITSLKSEVLAGATEEEWDLRVARKL